MTLKYQTEAELEKYCVQEEGNQIDNKLKNEMIISQERNGLDIAVQPLVDLLEEDREAEEELLSDFDLEQEALVSLS